MTIKVCLNRLPKLINFIKKNETYLLKTRPITSLINQQPQRYYSDVKKSESKQIYYGALTPQIKAIKLFSFSSSLVGIVCQPFLYQEIVSTGNVPVIVAAYSFIGFFTLVTPILLHLLTKRYVTHLIYKEDTGSYVAKTVNFFCLTKETEFKADDVVVPDVPGLFTSIIAKGTPLFFDKSLEDNRQHYIKIMGFDKPIDFQLKIPPVDKKD